MQDNWESARKEFEAALRIDPSYVENLDALGLALEALGDDTGAVASYKKAIALNDERKGNFASAHVNLSAYYNRTGNSEQALEYARRAIELDPKSDRAWFQAGKGRREAGAAGRCRRRHEPSYLIQCPGLFLLLRSGRPLPPPWQDGRQSKSARFVLPPGQGNERAGENASKCLQSPPPIPPGGEHEPTAPVGCNPVVGSCRMGATGAALMRELTPSVGCRPFAVRCFHRRDGYVRPAACQKHFRQRHRTSSFCWKKWAAASPCSITTTMAGSISFW